MTAIGIPRKLARKVAWAVAMSTAAYGTEALSEGQRWLLNGFDKLTRAIGQAVAGTFSKIINYKRVAGHHPSDNHLQPPTFAKPAGLPRSLWLYGGHDVVVWVRSRALACKYISRRLLPSVGSPLYHIGHYSARALDGTPLHASCKATRPSLTTRRRLL